MKFGEKIDYLMIKNGVKYATELASAIGLSADTINQYRKKDTADGVDSMRIKKIANYFGVSSDYLLAEDKELDSDTLVDNLKYFDIKNNMKIDIEDLVKEMKFIIMNYDIEYKNKSIEDKKRYILDTLDIGIKLFRNNL